MSKFLTHINLNGNELQNVVLQPLGTPPSANAKTGGIYFDSSVGVKRITYHDGSSWVTVQPYDTDLANIAALTGTSGFLKTNGSGTWSVDTNTYLTSSTGVSSVNASVGAVTGVAVTAGTLGQFAATTSSALAGVISDETGSGALVFGTSPAITTSLTTGSSSFDLINTTATTINFGGAATTLNIGNASGTVTIAGNLTVEGITTTVNSTTITVDDKNLELGSTASPTDAGADGGGITLKGTTDKTWNWIDATDSWTSSEHIDLASGKTIKFNGGGTSSISATQYTGNANTATTATNVTGGAAGSLVYQTGSGATTTLGLGTTGYALLAGASAPVWTKTRHYATLSTSATSYSLTHGLGTADLVVSVYDTGTGEVVYADIVNTDTTTTVSFATAPTAGQYRVVILA